MAMTDPVGDLLTRIRNGQSARLESVTVPASRMRSNVLDLLQTLPGFPRGETALAAAAGSQKMETRCCDVDQLLPGYPLGGNGTPSTLGAA